jgi:hypothetical protein
VIAVLASTVIAPEQLLTTSFRPVLHIRTSTDPMPSPAAATPNVSVAPLPTPPRTRRAAG